MFEKLFQNEKGYNASKVLIIIIIGQHMIFGTYHIVEKLCINTVLPEHSHITYISMDVDECLDKKNPLNSTLDTFTFKECLARFCVREISVKYIFFTALWSYLTKIYRESYMSAYTLLNLLNEFGKSDKMRG